MLRTRHGRTAGDSIQPRMGLMDWNGREAAGATIPAARASDWLNLLLLATGVGVLLADAARPTTGRVISSVALALCGLAVFAGWQVIRRSWFASRMPVRWRTGEARVVLLKIVHGTVAVVGGIGYFGFLIVWVLHRAAISRAVFPVAVFGYLIVQATFAGFFRDHLPAPQQGERRRISHDLAA
jgi:hypothetical protein